MGGDVGTMLSVLLAMCYIACAFCCLFSVPLAFQAGAGPAGQKAFFRRYFVDVYVLPAVSAPHDHGHDVFRVADQHRRANSCQRCFFQSIARHSGWAALVGWVLTASFGLL